MVFSVPPTGIVDVKWGFWKVALDAVRQWLRFGSIAVLVAAEPGAAADPPITRGVGSAASLQPTAKWVQECHATALES